jgi:hypothetical protein
MRAINFLKLLGKKSRRPPMTVRRGRMSKIEKSIEYVGNLIKFHEKNLMSLKVVSDISKKDFQNGRLDMYEINGFFMSGENGINLVKTQFERIKNCKVILRILQNELGREKNGYDTCTLQGPCEYQICGKKIESEADHDK